MGRLATVDAVRPNEEIDLGFLAIAQIRALSLDAIFGAMEMVTCLVGRMSSQCDGASGF